MYYHVTKALTAIKSWIREGRLHRISLEALWLVLGHLFVMLGGLVGVRVLTQVLSPAAYGELALGLAAAAFVGQIIFGPLSNGASRYYSVAVSRSQINVYAAVLKNLFFQGLLLCCLLLLVCLFGLLIISKIGYINLAIAAMFFALITGANSTVYAVFSSARARAVVSLSQGTDAWLKILMALLFLQFTAASGVAIISGYILSGLLIFSVQWRILKKCVILASKSDSASDSGSAWRERVWNYSWPFAFWGIFTGIQLASDRWALDYWGSNESVGLFAVLYQLGYAPVLMATTMLSQLLTPIFYARAGDIDKYQKNTEVFPGRVKRITSVITMLVIITTIGSSLAAFFLHDFLFDFLVAAEYRKISSMLPVMILAGGLFAAAQTVALALLSFNKTRALLGVKIGSALIGIALNFIGAYLYGAQGVAVAALAYSIIYLIWMAVLLQLEMPQG